MIKQMFGKILLFQRHQILQTSRKSIVIYAQNSILCTEGKQFTRNLSTRFRQDEQEDVSLLPYTSADQLLERKKSITRVRTKLVDLLNISSEQVNQILLDFPVLKSALIHDLVNTYNYCILINIRTDIIVKHPWILTIPKLQLKEKIKILNIDELDLNKTIPLVKQKIDILTKTVKVLKEEHGIVPHNNRIYYLSVELGCPADEISYAISRNNFFTFVPFPRVVKVINILKAKGVPTDNILGDLWIFKYKPETIDRRLQFAVDAQISNIRTWMVRCKSMTLERTLQRHTDNRKILGEKSDMSEYLAERLNLDMEYAKLIVDKHNEIKRMNTTKAKEILDYLFSEGFTQSQVIRCPRILCCSLKTIQERQKLFKSLGFFPSTLVIFVKSQTQFDVYHKIVLRKLKILAESKVNSSL